MTFEKRFVIGIDLGTTNTSVAYVDLTADRLESEKIQIFPVPQLIGPGEFAPLSVLPSFLYIPGEFDIAEQDMAAPWTIDQRSRDDRNFAGAFARDHGAKIPSRLVSSAKSWLCNKDVDTLARILPWGAAKDVFKVSPVHASAAYLKHIRKAWNVAMGDDEEGYLEHQMVILTVPASFDEVARDLTMQAARLAGYGDVILLEEPLAAFYSWLAGREKDWPEFVRPGQLILVCDVGGGTTDFTLIALRQAEGSPRFERIAVGDHLILGGDNMDFAIAACVAERLGKTPEALGGNDWKSLVHQCRQIKEQILDGLTDRGRITLVGAGSGLIAGTQTAKIERQDTEAIVLDRFFPISGSCDLSETPTGNNAWGLPYESDTAITGHLNRFLDRHRDQVHASTGADLPRPDLILFNGGALKAPILQHRVLEAVGRHFPGNDCPDCLENQNLDLAVSLGAAYYGMVKSGIGVRVGSGSARSYYMGVGADDTTTGESPPQTVCIVERGLEEGSAIALPDHDFKVRANQPVSIELYSSSYRSGDRSGDLLTVDESLTPLPPLNTVIQFGDKGLRSDIPVRLEATYTEVGTLEIWCQSLHSPHRWQLRFQLRGRTSTLEVNETDILEVSRVDEARTAIQQAFTTGDPKRLPPLMNDIAAILERPRDRWPLGVLRSLADTLLELAAVRSKSAEMESRWMNLLGFCLRPGMGDGFDSQRVKSLWRSYKKGPVHLSAPQVRLEWWILWRRVAAGLSAGQQRQFYQDLYPLLTSPKKLRRSRQETTEMWMAMASMERLSVKDKVGLGNRLIADFQQRKPQPQLLWTLSRVGARELLYGSIDRVIPPAEISGWVEGILSMTWKNPKPAAAMLSQMCRKTNDPLRDIDPGLRDKAVQWMTESGEFSEQVGLIVALSPRQQREQNAVFGESLPAGLVLGA